MDNKVAWFNKICLHAGKNCDDHLWKFERIPGTILIGNDTKTLPNKVTRNECQQNCLTSRNFECRSTKFRIKDSNYGPNSVVKGTCTLSNTDRHLLPNSFRIGREDEEYFENLCTKNENNDSKNTFCAYEEYGNVIQQHTDLMYENKTKPECEKLCDDIKIFHCRGFSLNPSPSKYTCLLHSEDTKIYGPRSLIQFKNGFYYEKARCLNISVTCTDESMTVVYHPEVSFLGRMYMQGFSDHPECFTKGQGFNTLTLKLLLPSSQCGIIEAISPDNRRLLSASLIIQYNNFIQTQGDRLIKVGCIFGNDSKLVVGTGVSVVPNNSNNGSFLINSTSSPSGDAPLVQMKIVDHYSKEEVSDTQIGQELDLIIESSTKGNYDIWAGHLIAMTESGAESIYLLDDRGCPTDPNVFPYLEKVTQDNKTELIATFQAFKFSSSPAVRFSVIVQFCPDKCPEVDCSSQYRQKRAQIVTTFNGTKVLRVNRTEFETLNSKFYQKPLEIQLTVQNQRLYPDKLAVGVNKILVAGYNYETNEICVDYSLFLGLIISWVLIQIIFAVSCIIVVRKYKIYYQDEYMKQAYEEYNKNFDIGISNLDNRRVRWADSGDEM
ncbi:hypothetical protein WA026_008548 [Henosepilachna vigintioctopunctata]